MNNEKIVAEGSFTLIADDWHLSTSWPTPELRWLETETGKTLQQKWIEESNNTRRESWVDIPTVREIDNE